MYVKNVLHSNQRLKDRSREKLVFKLIIHKGNLSLNVLKLHVGNAGADPGIFFRRGAPLGNDVTDR